MIAEYFKLIASRAQVSNQRALRSTAKASIAQNSGFLSLREISTTSSTRDMSTAAAAKVSADVDVAHDLCSGGSHAIRLSPQQEQVANLVNATEGEQFRSGNMQIAAACLIDSGKQVEVEFQDKSRYAFHTGWLKDSAPSQFNDSFNRHSMFDFLESFASVADDVKVVNGGSSITVDFQAGAESDMHEFNGRWLHAFAPYVARPINGMQKAVSNHGGLLEEMTIEHNKDPKNHWGADHKVRGFDARKLSEDMELQVEFLETLATDGLAMVYDLDEPEGHELGVLKEPLERLANKVVGRLYQPPRRKYYAGMMHSKMEKLSIGDSDHLSDYNFDHELSMHTDHAIYHSTPGYLQWNWQALGSVRTKCSNGVAVAEYLRKTDPKAFELLTTVNITHALRTNHYSVDGDYQNSPGKFHEGSFEEAHTHPVIKLDERGNVVQIIHNELKRAIWAIPHDKYVEYLGAYTKFTHLCEDPRFVCHFDWPERSCLVLNNFTVLHGRATKPKDSDRIFGFCYIRKCITENRYRLLKQRQLELRDGLDCDWSRPIPNQVLKDL